jgi:two-component system, OmpR family, alkaline phosphatase synthesis response regulator PhoP
MEKTRILIVDDELPAARMLKANLEATGRYEARVGQWPEDTVAVAREFKPHLILLDIIMPRMTGGDVAAAVKADPELKDTAIVFLTAALRREFVEQHDGTAANYPCITKPASLEDIVLGIEANLPK